LTDLKRRCLPLALLHLLIRILFTSPEVLAAACSAASQVQEAVFVRNSSQAVLLT
jgi:hypothetical protein